LSGCFLFGCRNLKTKNYNVRKTANGGRRAPSAFGARAATPPKKLQKIKFFVKKGCTF